MTVSQRSSVVDRWSLKVVADRGLQPMYSLYSLNQLKVLCGHTDLIWGGFFAPLEWKEVKTFGVGGWLVRRLRIENAVLLVGRKGGKNLKVVTKTKQVNPSFLFLLSWLCSSGWNLWQSLRRSPFLVHRCLLLKNKSRNEIKTVAIFCSLAAVPWRGKGWREKKREEGWSRRRREASKREREKKRKRGSRKRRELVGPRQVTSAALPASQWLSL